MKVLRDSRILSTYAIYKLIGFRIQANLLFVIYGGGLTKEVASFYLFNEAKVFIESVVAMFKEYFQSWSDLAVTMSGKILNKKDDSLSCFYHISF